jgi:hypothetical protein
MGSCASAPQERSPHSTTAEVQSPKIGSSAKTDPTTVNSESSKEAPKTTVISYEKLQGEDTDSEEVSHTPPTAEHPKKEEESKQNKHQTTRSRRVPLSKVRPGYSSGGSSEYSDESGHNSSSYQQHAHLADWKNELKPDGDLCKGVVRIEVSSGI